MRLKRRLIPPVFSAAMIAIASLPHVSNRLDVESWTTLYSVIIFSFLVILFIAMRRRMIEPTRKLTIFGAATVDLFTAFILFFLTFTIVSGTGYYYIRVGTERPMILQNWIRVSFIGAGSLVLATGIAVAWEMRRARGVLEVHEQHGPSKTPGTLETVGFTEGK